MKAAGVLALLGCSSAVAGVALLSVPAALVVLGAFLLIAAYMAAYAAGRSQP